MESREVGEVGGGGVRGVRGVRGRGGAVRERDRPRAGTPGVHTSGVEALNKWLEARDLVGDRD